MRQIRDLLIAKTTGSDFPPEMATGESAGYLYFNELAP